MFRTVTTKRIFQSNLRPSRFIAGNKKLKVETVAKSLNKKTTSKANVVTSDAKTKPNLGPGEAKKTSRRKHKHVAIDEVSW